MDRISWIWNHTLLGIPSAVLLGLQIFLRSIANRVSTLLWRGNLGSMGPSSRIQRSVTIRRPGGVSIGEDTVVGVGSTMVAEHCDSFVRIGNRVVCNPCVYLDFTGGLVIEDDVVLSKEVRVFTHSHGLDPKSKGVKTPLVIEVGAWLGQGVVVTEGVARIGRHSVVAAGAVVTKEVPPGVVVAGVPARFVKHIARQ